MLLSEMSVQEVVMDCASNLLHFSIDHRSEYDPDVIKTRFSQLFAQLLIQKNA